MTDFAGLSIEGRIATPSDADWDEARLAWNLAADLQPSAVAFVESAEDVAKTVRFAAENGLRVSGQGTGHGAAPLGSLEDAILIKTAKIARHRGRRRPAGRASRSRRALDRAGRSGKRPRPGRDAGVLARRRSRRLHAGRRPQLVRACAWLRLQPTGGDRARHRRGRATDRRRRERRRPLLGAARRGRRLRDRHRPSRRAAADRRDLRRRPALPGRGRSRGGPRIPRLGGGTARRGDLGGALRHAAADPRRARAAARDAAADHRRRLHRHPGGGRSGVRAAARHRRADHGHLRVDADRGAEPDPHGPRESGARQSAAASSSPS